MSIFPVDAPRLPRGFMQVALQHPPPRLPALWQNETFILVVSPATPLHCHMASRGGDEASARGAFGLPAALQYPGYHYQGPLGKVPWGRTSRLPR